MESYDTTCQYYHIRRSPSSLVRATGRAVGAQTWQAPAAFWLHTVARGRRSGAHPGRPHAPRPWRRRQLADPRANQGSCAAPGGMRGRTEVAQMLREAGATAPPVEPIATVLATASAERGGEVASNCMGVTRSDPADNRHTAGPTLWGVVGRAPASLPRFEYSSALQRLGGVWHEEALNTFVAHPKATAPGTRMQFEGLANAEERAAPAPPWSI